MQHGFQRATLAPYDFAIDAVQVAPDRIQIPLRSRQPWGTCLGWAAEAGWCKAAIGAGLQICRLVDDG